MEGTRFDESGFFAAIDQSGARVLLIGRRALAALGMPVLTADYDLWVHFEDIEALNDAAAPFDLIFNATPDVARRRGRYVLENAEHVDVMIARSQSTKDGQALAFEEAWRDRVVLRSSDYSVSVPSIEHLIITKRWAMRPRDLDDIRFLEGIRGQGEKS